MDFVKTVIEVLAALMLATLPAALLFWLLIHRFVRLWRRLGAATGYAIVGGVCLVVAYLIWTVRDPLMRVHWGYRPGSITAGALLYLAGAAWDIRVYQRLKFPILLGLPELSRKRPSKLLTDGAYSVVRHPRYLAALVGIVGFSLICNYPVLYGVVAASVPVAWLVIVLEERELRNRFGREHDEYCKRVPRFLPRWRR